MTGCNCSPLPDYAADYIENLNKWIQMNKEFINWYLSWYQIWYNSTQQFNKDIS
jgi:hypothetical protein